jgi:hypothetical protein
MSSLPVVSSAVEEALSKWMRAAELTCDRCGAELSRDVYQKRSRIFHAEAAAGLPYISFQATMASGTMSFLLVVSSGRRGPLQVDASRGAHVRRVWC